MINVLHLTIGHSPFDDRIFYKECSLLKRKYAVLILAFESDGIIKDMSGKKKNPGIYDDISVDGFSLIAGNYYISISLR